MHLFPGIVAGGEERPDVAGSHEGGNRLDRVGAFSFPDLVQGGEPPLLRVPGHRRGIGDGEEAAVLRERDQFDRLRQHRVGTVHPRHAEGRMIEDVPLGVSVEEFRESFTFHARYLSTKRRMMPLSRPQEQPAAPATLAGQSPDDSLQFRP